MDPRDRKPEEKPADSKTDRPATQIAPVKKRIGEGDKNLLQRRAWFERRTKKGG